MATCGLGLVDCFNGSERRQKRILRHDEETQREGAGGRVEADVEMDSISEPADSVSLSALTCGRAWPMGQQWATRGNVSRTSSSDPGGIVMAALAEDAKIQGPEQESKMR